MRFYECVRCKAQEAVGNWVHHKKTFLCKTCANEVYGCEDYDAEYDKYKIKIINKK